MIEFSVNAHRFMSAGSPSLAETQIIKSPNASNAWQFKQSTLSLAVPAVPR
jgi:hypothetical protein